MTYEEHLVEHAMMCMWRTSDSLLSAPLPLLAFHIDTLVDTYNNLTDVIRLANMHKNEGAENA